MKNEIKNRESQERQTYVPASMKVINVTAQRVLCGSIDNPDDYPGHEM